MKLIPAMAMVILSAIFAPRTSEAQDKNNTQRNVASAASFKSDRLFSDFTGGDLPQTAQTIIDEVRKSPGVVNAKITRMRSSEETKSLLRKIVASSEPSAQNASPEIIYIDLFEGRTIKVQGTSSPSNLQDGSWYGRIVEASDKPAAEVNGDVVLSFSNGELYGSISLAGSNYELASQGGNLVTILEVDLSKGPPDHVPQNQRYRQFGALDNSASPIIRVLVAYTAAAKRQLENASKGVKIESFISSQINNSNQSYDNSNIPLRLDLASIVQVSYTETGNWALDRDRFFNSGDGYMDSVFAEREEVKADVSVLLFSNTAACGEVMDVKATARTAFAVVDVSRFCNLKYSFTHEVGHLIGAEHDLENASRHPSYPWAHGFINKDLWRTMMAYQQDCNPCTRLLYWSSPAVNYNGIAMGTADKHDNARVLRENAKSVSAFR